MERLLVWHDREGMRVQSIDIVEDRTAQSRCDEGFLKVSRLLLQNIYADGSRSQTYACDVVSRPGADAVVAILYELGPDGEITTVLREAPRPPIYLRKFKRFEHPDPGEYSSIVEVVAGIVEEGDGAHADGLRRRASIEAREEAGFDAPADSFVAVGGESFASPGTSDEKVYFCAGPVRLEERSTPSGDGSVMEESAELVLRSLAEAIEACRTGEIPDMKTEVALLRLADHLGYIPQLGCFQEDLPADLRARYRRLGVVARESREEAS
jgi:ADP-ribose pyrophosphatase